MLEKNSDITLDDDIRGTEVADGGQAFLNWL